MEWILKKPLEVYCDSVRAEYMEANAKFHAKAGLTPKIIRKTDGKCCKWCNKLAGEYEYPNNVPADVFKKHENCNCTVEYDPADGSKKRQDVWSKLWKESRKDIDRRDSYNGKKSGHWSANRGLEEHFKDHGESVGAKTVGEYIKKANEFWGLEVSDDVQEIEFDDGSIARFNHLSSEFSVIESDGVIRTYFVPDDPLYYWHGQKNREDVIYDSSEDY